MTNGEKYKSAKERAEAIQRFCRQYHDCNGCPFEDKLGDVISTCQFYWLDLEAEAEEPLPCPFCGDECFSDTDSEDNWIVYCNNCLYTMGGQDWSEEECVKRHNRVARAAKEKEANDANA